MWEGLLLCEEGEPLQNICGIYDFVNNTTITIIYQLGNGAN